MAMRSLITISAIFAGAYYHKTDMLLAIIAFELLEIVLTTTKLREGMTDLCRMLKDDEPDVEGVIRQFDEAVRRMDAEREVERQSHEGMVGYTRIGPNAFVRSDIDQPPPVVAKAPTGPQTMHRAPADWMEFWTKES